MFLISFCWVSEMQVNLFPNCQTVLQPSLFDSELHSEIRFFIF